MFFGIRNIIIGYGDLLDPSFSGLKFMLFLLDVLKLSFINENAGKYFRKGSKEKLCPFCSVLLFTI